MLFILKVLKNLSRLTHGHNLEKVENLWFMISLDFISTLLEHLFNVSGHSLKCFIQ